MADDHTPRELERYVRRGEVHHELKAERTKLDIDQGHAFRRLARAHDIVGRFQKALLEVTRKHDRIASTIWDLEHPEEETT